MTVPAFSFLVENPRTGKKVLFDLGVRKDWENFPPKVVARLKAAGAKISVEKNVAEILGDLKNEIDEIIWSHSHFGIDSSICDEVPIFHRNSQASSSTDHTGDPSTFPTSTALVVGPGLPGAQFPGYPTSSTSPILATDHAGRPVREISFRNDAITIGGYPSVDYWGDGSFYLLATPGHAVGHMSALVRTTPTTFAFLGGDICHHGGQFRPTSAVPLPGPPYHPPCPGAVVMAAARAAHPRAPCDTEPFYRIADTPGKTVAADAALAQAQVVRLEAFDADEDVLVLIAHDTALLGVVALWPQTANAWKAAGWKESVRWGFLNDLAKGGEK
ncbi:hypothetical protein HDU87_008643 [Geranomyces variabilis]|uniref:Metallo-beta-lactamase domain-containing protein n=1 Tax=Geranomyces variabilis TaxID=109894 RepID=A0AAD5TCU9_9FUNG|nr:hypothetical protein HDU87_008643 [Geranomyces variabilis]